MAEINGIKISGEQIQAISFLSERDWKSFFEQLKNQESDKILGATKKKELLGIHFRLLKIKEIENLFLTVIDKHKKKD